MGLQTADAVVIGAGINGAATAYNLIKRGMKDVILLEKHLIASGGTGRSAAIVRQHYSSDELVRMVRRSVDVREVSTSELNDIEPRVDLSDYRPDGTSRMLAGRGYPKDYQIDMVRFNLRRFSEGKLIGAAYGTNRA